MHLVLWADPVHGEERRLDGEYVEVAGWADSLAGKGEYVIACVKVNEGAYGLICGGTSYRVDHAVCHT